MSILDFLTFPQPSSFPQRKFQLINEAELGVLAALNETALPLLEFTPLQCCGHWWEAALLCIFPFSAPLTVPEKLETLRSGSQTGCGHGIGPRLRHASSSLLYETCSFVFYSTSVSLCSCTLSLSELRVLVSVFSLFGLGTFSF